MFGIYTINKKIYLLLLLIFKILLVGTRQIKIWDSFLRRVLRLLWTDNKRCLKQKVLTKSSLLILIAQSQLKHLVKTTFWYLKLFYIKAKNWKEYNFMLAIKELTLRNYNTPLFVIARPYFKLYWILQSKHYHFICNYTIHLTVFL